MPSDGESRIGNDMRKLLTFLVVLLVLGGIGAASYRPALNYWHQRNRPQWRTDQVVRGDLVAVVNATGQVKPVLSVQIGAFVSGPIIELPVEFNQEVKKDDLLARIDPRIYQAQVDQETAILQIRKAEIERVQALLQQARNDEKRGEALRARNDDFLSDAERDQLKFNRMSLEAQFQVAEASVEQAKASLKNAQANLDYTRHHVAGRRHRDRPQDRPRPDPGGPISDAAVVRRGAPNARKNACPRPDRRSGHRLDPRSPDSADCPSSLPSTPTWTICFRASSKRFATVRPRRKTSSPIR